jgi:purine-binding chemotaxis protein CheW
VADHEYDDDRAGDFDHGDQVPPGAFAEELAFEAPDLATAFLAQLDMVDDRAFVAPPLDDLLPGELHTPEPVVAAAPEPEPPAYEMPETMAIRLDASAIAALQAGTFELTPDAPAIEPPIHQPAAPLDAQGYVIDHDPAPADDSPAARAVAEAFAREQAALELWGSDDASAVLDSAAEDASSTEYAESMHAVDSIESIEAGQAVAGWSASVDTDAPLNTELAPELPPAPQAEAADEPPSNPETISNADSYYDPDTLRLTRPLFSADEPRAFAAPVYVGDAPEGETAAEVHGEAEAEVLEDLEEFVAFSLGDTRCVVPIRNVIEIGRIPQAVPVPNAPAWLHGLGNLRGQVLSLIDLRAFLGIGRVRPATGRMLVLRGDDDEVQAGLLVDHVHQIVSLSATRFHPVPETLARHYARHAWGVCDYGNFTMIGLEVDSLLGVDNMAPLVEAAEVV